jgi:hypothetical protein
VTEDHQGDMIAAAEKLLEMARAGKLLDVVVVAFMDPGPDPDEGDPCGFLFQSAADPARAIVVMGAASAEIADQIQDCAAQLVTAPPEAHGPAN